MRLIVARTPYDLIGVLHKFPTHMLDKVDSYCDTGPYVDINFEMSGTL